MMDGLIEARVILAATALMAFAGGCERRDASSRSMVEARNTMTAVGAGGSAAAPKSTLEGGYAKVLATIKDDAGSSESVKAINAAFMGGALGGQGELAAGAFREADAALLRQIVVAKSRLSLYLEQRGLADALSGYDPNVDIAAFDGQIAEREREREAAKARLAENEAKVTGIRGQSEAKAEAARSMMASLGALRERLLEASSSDRPSLAEQLNTERRKAEGVMKESELLDAEAAKIAPISEELRLRVEQIERQISSLQKAKEQARLLSESRVASAAEASRGATQTASELAQELEAVQTTLSERVKPAFEAALSKLSQSAGKFGQARGGPDAALLSLSNGMSAQAIGSLQREYAEVLARVSSLLASAGAAKPAIPGASGWTSAAESIASEAKQALDAALQQYEKAKSSFRSGGGSAELREHVDRLSAKVNETWVRLGGAPPAEEKAVEPEPESEIPAAVEEPGMSAPASDEPAEEAPPAEGGTEQPTQGPGRSG
ncbi:MAG: hypothetical protein JNK58_00220 [Phycisphaerae bacterium]|nr:hypothetical protein [Phycisphaerae bacterium]